MTRESANEAARKEQSFGIIGTGAGTRSLLGLCLFVLSLAAQAAGGYWGIGLSGVRSEDEAGDSVEPRNLYAHVGYDFSAHFGFEVQSSITLSDDEFDGLDWSAAVNGLYLKGGFPVTRSVTVSVLGGYAVVDLAADVGFGFVRTDESGPSYGLGADVGLTDNVDLSIRYMRYLEDDGLFTEVTGSSIALSRSF